MIVRDGMPRATVSTRVLVTFLFMAAFVVQAACDKEWTDTDTDASADLTADLSGDDPSTSCTYPDPPYEFSVGSTVAPMRWTSTDGQLEETMEADLEAFYCDPAINSIFLIVTNTT